MKVPNSIKKSIQMCANANRTANRHDKVIRDWLLENGYDWDSDDIIDCMVDDICQGSCNGAEHFISELERL